MVYHGVLLTLKYSMGFSSQTIKEFLTKMADALEVEAHAISVDTPLSALDWDSLAIISTIALVDECLGEVISAEKIAKCHTIGDIIGLGEKI